MATPLLYLFKPVLSPRPSLTRCLLGFSRFSCSSSRSSSSSSWAPPRRCRLAARSALPALRTAVAMADIKTGIFAKNVQKRLNRAQEKVSRGRRAAGQVARGGAGTMAVLALRCRAAGSGAARCGARASSGWRRPLSLLPGIAAGQDPFRQRGHSPTVGTLGTRRPLPRKALSATDS